MIKVVRYLRDFVRSFAPGAGRCRSRDVKCVWPAGAALGECPVWVPDQKALFWVDIRSGAVHRYGVEDGRRTSWHFDGQVGALAPRRGGGFALALDDRFFVTGDDLGDLRPLTRAARSDGALRFNDAKCDRHGWLWSGTMDVGGTRPIGDLCRISGDGTLEVIDSGYTIPNGPAFCDRHSVMYVADSPLRRIYAFDTSDDGRVANKRLFAELAVVDGYPDGMAVDSDGHLWVAHYCSARVSRFAPNGRIERALPLCVTNVTSVAFGGRDLDRLFVTTAIDDAGALSSGRRNWAGGLLEVAVSCTGALPGTFAAAPAPP